MAQTALSQARLRLAPAAPARPPLMRHPNPPAFAPRKMMAQDLSFTCRRYGDNALQQVAIWERRGPAPDKASRGDGGASQPWVIYIHGGAWRDPLRTQRDFEPTMAKLIAAEAPVAGFASIDYRLSPHDDFPQNLADTPPADRREAFHPDHIADVRAALRLLATEYGLADGGYVLVGHSAGAMMSMQLLTDMGVATAGEAPPAPMPAVIIAIAGVYDLGAINARHDGAYAGFISSAFGPGEDAWRAASPACFAGNLRERWPSGTLAVLAHSPEDSLVDAAETDAMASKLAADGVPLQVVKDLYGDHDKVWEDGVQIARLVGEALARLRTEGQDLH